MTSGCSSVSTSRPRPRPRSRKRGGSMAGRLAVPAGLLVLQKMLHSIKETKRTGKRGRTMRRKSNKRRKSTKRR